MAKFLIEVYIPAADKTYDMFLPEGLMLHEVMKMLEKAVGELCGGVFIMNGDTVLCNRDDGAILNINMSVGELGLKNGARLLLM